MTQLNQVSDKQKYIKQDMVPLNIDSFSFWEARRYLENTKSEYDKVLIHWKQKHFHCSKQLPVNSTKVISELVILPLPKKIIKSNTVDQRPEVLPSVMLKISWHLRPYWRIPSRQL